MMDPYQEGCVEIVVVGQKIQRQTCSRRGGRGLWRIAPAWEMPGRAAGRRKD